MPLEGGTASSSGRRSLLSLSKSLIPKRTPSPKRFGRKCRSGECDNAESATASSVLGANGASNLGKCSSKEEARAGDRDYLASHTKNCHASNDLAAITIPRSISQVKRDSHDNSVTCCQFALSQQRDDGGFSCSSDGAAGSQSNGRKSGSKAGAGKRLWWSLFRRYKKDKPKKASPKGCLVPRCVIDRVATIDLDDDDDFIVDEDEICTNQEGELKTSKGRQIPISKS